VFEQPDHWKDQPHDCDEPAGDEGLTESTDYFERAKAAQNPRHETRNSYNEKRIDPEDEPDYDDRDAD
jgi:hypothetical protein